MELEELLLCYLQESLALDLAISCQEMRRLHFPPLRETIIRLVTLTYGGMHKLIVEALGDCVLGHTKEIKKPN